MLFVSIFVHFWFNVQDDPSNVTSNLGALIILHHTASPLPMVAKYCCLSSLSTSTTNWDGSFCYLHSNKSEWHISSVTAVPGCGDWIVYWHDFVSMDSFGHCVNCLKELCIFAYLSFFWGPLAVCLALLNGFWLGILYISLVCSQWLVFLVLRPFLISCLRPLFNCYKFCNNVCLMTG